MHLGTYEYTGDFSGVKVIGSFDKLSPQPARPMARQSDGTYLAEFDAGEEAFSYQLAGVTKDGSSVNGTQSEDYVYDGGGGYRSTVTPRNSRVRIVFDPRKLAPAGTEARVRFGDKNSRLARFAAIYAELLKRRNSFSAAFATYKRGGKPAYSFNYGWAPFLSDLSTQIRAETDPFLRQALLFSYLDLGYGAYGAPLDRAMAQKAIAEIPPTSPLWSIEPDLIGVALENSGQPERYTRYLQQIIENHPDQWIRTKARKDYAPDRNIMVGKALPAFSFLSVDDPTAFYTNESLRGKILLIDFWATWCKPCVEDIENLQEAYQRYKRRGFEILSLSFDDKIETVIKFRQGKWKMPWLNSFVSGGFGSEAIKKFEISGIPRPILVDRTGKIIAMGNDLRGLKLDRILSRVMGAEK